MKPSSRLLGLSFAALVLAPAGVAAQEGDPFKDVKHKDLAPGTLRAFQDSLGMFYAMTGPKTDLYVLLLRSRLLEDAHTREPFKAFASIGSLKDRPDCAALARKVGTKRMEKVREALDGKFHCFDTSLTTEQVVASNPALADSINSPNQVDAHMGWFSATGSRLPVEKLVRNLAENEKACTCIAWPLTSVSNSDTLFASHMREAASRYPGNERLKPVLRNIRRKP